MCSDRNLIKFVKSIVETYADIDECVKDYNIDKNLLKSILNSPDKLNEDMYNLISTILRKPVRKYKNIKDKDVNYG